MDMYLKLININKYNYKSYYFINEITNFGVILTFGSLNKEFLSCCKSFLHFLLFLLFLQFTTAQFLTIFNFIKRLFVNYDDNNIQ